MIKAEVVKFEAQDVITASGAAAPNVQVIPSCNNGNGHTMSFTNVNGTWKMVCSNCGYTGDVTGDQVQTN